jgi:hypothetical protein
MSGDATIQQPEDSKVYLGIGKVVTAPFARPLGPRTKAARTSTRTWPEEGQYSSPSSPGSEDSEGSSNKYCWAHREYWMSKRRQTVKGGYKSIGWDWGDYGNLAWSLNRGRA